MKEDSSNLEICPLCERPIGDEKNGNKHHLRPKSKGGKSDVIVVLHRVCHDKIHSVFTNKQLADHYNTIEKLLTNEDIQKFVKWVKKKAPDYYDHSKRKNSFR
jgi:hypothetical protein